MLLVYERAVHIHRLLNVEVSFATGALDHAAARFEQVCVLLPKSETADAVSVAGSDLNKAVAQIAVDDALERLDAVIQTRQGTDNRARNRATWSAERRL